jgi:exonuclease III
VTLVCNEPSAKKPPSSRKLKVFLLNIRGIKTAEKLAIFENYIENLPEKPHIIVLNEHWLCSFEVKHFRVKGYKLASAYGRRSRERGGVLILIANNLKNTTSLRLRSKEMIFEACALEVKIANQIFQVITVYRPSNPTNNGNLSEFFERLENLIEEKLSPGKELMVLGDLNVDLLKACDVNSKELLNIMDAFQLKLLNGQTPTRVTESSKTLIDHVFSSWHTDYDCDVLDTPFSDHSAVYCTFNVNVEEPRDSFRMVRDMSNENWLEFYNTLFCEQWTDMYYCEEGVSEKCAKFMRTLVLHYESCFPRKRITVHGNKRNKARISGATHQQKRKLREFGERLKDVTDPDLKKQLKLDYTSLEKYVGFCINNDIRNSNAKRIEKATSKSAMAWKIVHEENQTVKEKASLEKLMIEGVTVENSQEIANFLNGKFIESVPDNLQSLVDDYVMQITVDSRFELSEVTVDEIENIISNLPAKKAAGLDGISMQDLKRIGSLVAEPLCHLINCSFAEGKFPNVLKTSLVIPLHKKGDVKLAENYRPIALTSSISKVFEKAYLGRLCEYFAENNLLLDNQHGFRQGRSTVSALFDVVTEVFKSLEKREKLNMILYDFSNAFGSLVPQLLVQKLKMYGLGDLPLSWISTFLTERNQIVQLRSWDEKNSEILVRSEVLPCSMGVPQGSVAGPFSYIVYGNDMPLSVVLGCLTMFADDSTALIKGKTYANVNERTTDANQQMVEFAEANCLRLNPAKTKILQMHTKQTRNIVKPEVLLKGEQVETAEYGKLLGVTMSDTMSWKQQCEDVQGKLRSLTFMMVKLRQRLPYNVLRSVYFSYGQSQIMYAIAIWGASPHLQKVFVAQKRVVRAIEGVRYWKSKTAVTSCRPLFKKHGILPVFSLYVLECVKFVKKYPEKFRLISDVHSYNSRNKDKLYTESSTLKLSEENPAVKMVRLYNMLPQCVKAIERYENFVKAVKKILLDGMFYDYSEYAACDFASL